MATVDDAVVGYAMTGPNRDGGAELWAIYVIPAYQGKGIGHALWERATAHLRAAGFAEFGLWVVAGNAPARRFYERHGAEVIGERTDRLGESEVAEVRYRVALRPPDPPVGSDQRPMPASPSAGAGTLDSEGGTDGSSRRRQPPKGRR